MKNGLKLVISFIIGAASGGGIGWFITKTVLQKQYDEKMSGELQGYYKEIEEKYMKSKGIDIISEENMDELEEVYKDDDDFGDRNVGLSPRETFNNGKKEEKRPVKHVSQYENYSKYSENKRDKGVILKDEDGKNEVIDEVEDTRTEEDLVDEGPILTEENYDFEAEKASNEFPKDEENEPYICEDPDILPLHVQNNPIDVTYYLADRVLVEDVSHEKIWPDNNSIPQEILDEFAEDMSRVECFVYNPRIDILYSLCKTEDSYAEIMEAYNGGYKI